MREASGGQSGNYAVNDPKVSAQAACLSLQWTYIVEQHP